MLLKIQGSETNLLVNRYFIHNALRNYIQVPYVPSYYYNVLVGYIQRKNMYMWKRDTHIQGESCYSTPSLSFEFVTRQRFRVLLHTVPCACKMQFQSTFQFSVIHLRDCSKSAYRMSASHAVHLLKLMRQNWCFATACPGLSAYKGDIRQ